MKTKLNDNPSKLSTLLTWISKLMVPVAFGGMILYAMTSTVIASGTFDYKVLDKQHTYGKPQLTYRIDQKSPYYRKVWVSAINKWNKMIDREQLGKHVDVLVPAKKGETPDITMSAMNKFNWGGSNITGTTTQLSNSFGRVTSSKSRINIDSCKHYHYSFTDLREVAEHELGHAIGLPHSKDKSSIMYYMGISHDITAGDAESAEYLLTSR